MEGLVAPSAPDPDFWRGRRVLLTGHTGFKGAWLSLWLRHLGAEVSGYSSGIPTERSLFLDARIGELVHDGRGDVRDLPVVRETVAAFRPEIILHLAAQSLVRASYAQPVETYATNVMGTVHVLEAARTIGTGCAVLIVTTDKCYENREWIWGYRENEAMGGHDPYSSSKGCAELAISAYARSYGGPATDFRVASARAGNVIGGGDWSEDRLIPDLVRGLARGEPVAIRNPDAVRPWQHVLEPLSGYLLLARKLLERERSVEGQGWNFGPSAEAEVCVGEVAERICKLCSATDGWRSAATPGQRHEARLLRLDITKARTLLGWHPRWTLEQALARTIEIYRGPSEPELLRTAMLDQISAYTSESQRL